MLKINKQTQLLEVLRWSYTISILCYGLFLIIGLLTPVPLRPRVEVKNMCQNENSFEIRIKNSNFNSDSNIDEKGEYLIDVNSGINARKSEIRLLTEVFKQADRDKNDKLNSKELSDWIRNKILQHISQAVGNNYGLFIKIDTSPKDGLVTWKEYHAYFLRKRGFTDKYVERHDKKHRGLQRYIKEQIMKDKALWVEAAKTNPDSLTISEFLAFTHPESSVSNQLAMVDELFDKFDRDGDELLTENEFAVLQTEGNGDETLMVRQDEEQRRKEFRQSVDLNGDGKADRRELLHYIAPQSPRHAEHEAEALLSLADMDHDNMLSLDEILTHPDLFLKSKMIDTARSFHDEF